MKRKLALLACAGVAAVLIASGFWLERALRIDSCLDRGGAWDDKAGLCVGSPQQR